MPSKKKTVLRHLIAAWDTNFFFSNA
uniref:Uncharacterized protein n=1 Tax=Arundo donax TaxID=35708 RepID=A0A0A8YRZ1_ARUDO